MSGDFFLFVQEIAYNVDDEIDEAYLDGKMEFCDGYFTAVFQCTEEKAEMVEYRNGTYKLNYPSWKGSLEKILHEVLKIKRLEMHAEQAEQDRLEYERKCREFEDN